MCTLLQKCAEYHHFFSYFFHKSETFHRTKPNDGKLINIRFPNTNILIMVHHKAIVKEDKKRSYRIV